MNRYKPFPVEVVAGVVSHNLRVAYYEDKGELQVTCDKLYCEYCPINDYTSTHEECKQIVTYIRDHQLPSLLITNPELFV